MKIVLIYWKVLWVLYDTFIVKKREINYLSI